MAVIQSGATSDVMTVDPTQKGARVSPRPIEGEHYSIAGVSGLITGLNAADAMFALRWGSSTKTMLVHRIRAKVVVVTGFTAAQEVGSELYIARTYTASPSGQTGLTLTTNNAKRRASFGTTALTAARISTTGAVTEGTLTADAQPVAGAGAYALAAAATVQNPAFVLEKVWDDNGGPLQLTQDEGFVIRNKIAMGAAGTMRLYVEVDWTEVANGTGW